MERERQVNATSCSKRQRLNRWMKSRQRKLGIAIIGMTIAMVATPVLSWAHSIAGIDVISWGAPSSRLSGLGADVTDVGDAGSAVAALATNQVLWLGCCGYDDDFTPGQVASILAFVSGGGGLIVGQPNKEGAVGILPAGFGVFVSDRYYSDPSNLYITAAGSTHPITSEC